MSELTGGITANPNICKVEAIGSVTVIVASEQSWLCANTGSIVNIDGTTATPKGSAIGDSHGICKEDLSISTSA